MRGQSSAMGSPTYCSSVVEPEPPYVWPEPKKEAASAMIYGHIKNISLIRERGGRLFKGLYF